MGYIVATEQPPLMTRANPGGRRANRDADQLQPVGVRHALEPRPDDTAKTACGIDAARLYPLDLAWVVGFYSCPLCVVAIEEATTDS
ncbi:MAG: hypothetical protein JWO63_1884 [Frankiales bacterium]|nr:hypothetical protein [Frankiales bacterium]